jgi:hypothetical protein
MAFIAFDELGVTVQVGNGKDSRRGVMAAE